MPAHFALIFILSVHVHARLQAELARLFTHLHYGRFNIVHLSQIASKRYKRQKRTAIMHGRFSITICNAACRSKRS